MFTEKYVFGQHLTEPTASNLPCSLIYELPTKQGQIGPKPEKASLGLFERSGGSMTVVPIFTCSPSLPRIQLSKCTSANKSWFMILKVFLWIDVVLAVSNWYNDHTTLYRFFPFFYFEMFKDKAVGRLWSGTDNICQSRVSYTFILIFPDAIEKYNTS